MRHLEFDIKMTLFAKTLTVVKSTVDMLTSIVSSVTVPPAVKRIQCISFLSDRIEIVIRPTMTFN